MLKISEFPLRNKWMHDSLLELGFDGIFNNILRLTSHVCGVRFSQINIIGQERHWRLTDTGLCAETCDSSIALSELALHDNQFFEVTNFLKDKRIINQQLIINERIIRYFSAVPIILSNGSVIGTISIMECESYKLSKDKIALFTVLANDAASQIDLHLKNHELEKNNSLSESVKNSTSELVSLTNNNYKDLDEFAHRASHDLKAPLNAIKNIVSWIAEDIENGKFQDNNKHLAMVNTSVNRMRQLLTDLREYSKIGREVLPSEVINFKELVLNSYKAIKNNDNYKIIIESCDLELPKVPLYFVFEHLLSNAIKHHDKETGVIHISAVSNVNHYQLTITDDGPGIPIKLQNKIFENFQKLKSKDEVEGSGLGLAMIRKTLSSYSAEISVNSQPNNGATFTIVWPKHHSENSVISSIYKEGQV